MIVPMARIRIDGPAELLDDATCLLFELDVLHPEALPPGLAAQMRVRDRRAEDHGGGSARRSAARAAA